MWQQITLNNIEENLNFFSEMYDAVRLVDPLHKCVLKNMRDYIGKTDELCYDHWKRGAICDNCISIRANNSNKSFIKLEHKCNMLIMVTAIPVKTEIGNVVLELLKNVTDSMMFGPLDESADVSLSSMIADLNQKIVMDSLTSLHNRRYIDERLPVDIVDAVLTKAPLSLVYIDVDDFKSVNDTYGHSAGDVVLQAVTDIIKDSIRKDYDWAARYGGDEFLLCMRNTTYDEAKDICERIRNKIENTTVDIKGTSVNARVSIGIQTMNEERFTAEEMISLADSKMYEEKKHRKGLQ